MLGFCDATEATVAIMRPLILLFLSVAAPSGLAAERVCDQSESTVTVAPGGSLAASVQHQVCETAAGGAAAAITVFVGEAAAPLDGGRVVAVQVPRTRDEWPQAVWRSQSLLEVWVPNLAKVLQSTDTYQGVSVHLKYCGDDPAARARVDQHQADLQQWMQAVSRWAQARKDDPQGAGPRPVRPEEPRDATRPCSDSDIHPAR